MNRCIDVTTLTGVLVIFIAETGEASAAAASSAIPELTSLGLGLVGLLGLTLASSDRGRDPVEGAHALAPRPDQRRRSTAAAALVTPLLVGALLTIWALTARPAGATPVPDLLWDGGDPGSDPTNLWSETGGAGDWTLQGGLVQSSPFVSSAPGLSGAYDFDGADDVAELDGEWRKLLDGNANNDPLSFELWLRPDDLVTSGQILFEIGRENAGLSFSLDGADLLFRVRSGAKVLSLSHDLTGTDIGDFIQVVGTLDLGTHSWLYVEGQEVADAATDVGNWGADKGINGLGGVNGEIGGNDNGDLDGYGGFAGEIAMLRFHQNYVLSPSEVYTNYTLTKGPEPSTGLLLGLGLAVLAARRRPRSRRARSRASAS